LPEVLPDQEAQFLEQALTGDVDAFGELVRLFERPIFNLCYRMLGDAPEAEDASQEAFIRAYANLASYDRTRSFKTWLFSIASNHCIDRLRKRRLTLLSIDEPLPPHPALVGDQPDPEESVIQEEKSAFIQQLLDKLSPDYRAAVILRYWYDLSYQEMAEALDTSESAVKSRLFRARQALADLLDGLDAQAILEPLMAS
jgi:RNA polymerase sigma-70 factor (ECF subfamily)